MAGDKIPPYHFPPLPCTLTTKTRPDQATTTCSCMGQVCIQDQAGCFPLTLLGRWYASLLIGWGWVVMWGDAWHNIVTATCMYTPISHRYPPQFLIIGKFGLILVAWQRTNTYYMYACTHKQGHLLTSEKRPLLCEVISSVCGFTQCNQECRR